MIIHQHHERLMGSHASLTAAAAAATAAAATAAAVASLE
jgi:hypothetical protein